ncbi:MAG TPA: circadian clock KaiB family protein [Longimicrobiales bacterium]
MELRLYVAGSAPNSLQAKRNLDTLLASLDPASYRLEIIDCLAEPARTLADGVVVTPTLRRISPEPTCTVIGTLADEANVRAMICAQTR